MESIKLYLERFRGLQAPDTDLKKLIIQTVSDVVGVKLDKKSISFQGQTVFIKARSVIKAEIFIHRQEIIKQLEEKLDRSLGELV